MENFEIQEEIKNEEKNLQALEEIFNKKRSTYEEYKKIFSINDQKVKLALLTLLNMVYIASMLVLSPNIIISLIGFLPLEIFGYKISDHITEKIHNYFEKEIFKAGINMLDAKKEVEKAQKSLDKLKQELDQEFVFSNKEKLDSLRELSSNLKEFQENISLDDDHKKGPNKFKSY